MDSLSHSIRKVFRSSFARRSCNVNCDACKNIPCRVGPLASSYKEFILPLIYMKNDKSHL